MGRLLYISGPMSGLPDLNFPAFARAATALRQQGLEVLSAHEIPHDEPAPGALPWTTYLREDVRHLLTCDAIVMLPGWPLSRGARLELDVAVSLELPVFFWDERLGLVDMNAPARDRAVSA